MVPTRSPKLTQGVVDRASLPPGKTDHFVWDSEVPGFGLRLRQGGSRNFVFWYRVGPQRRKMNLGAASAITAAEARSGRHCCMPKLSWAEIRLARRL